MKHFEITSLFLLVAACSQGNSGPDAGPVDPSADARPRADAGNGAPIAVISAPAAASPGTLVDVYGTNSYDPDGDPLTYAWRMEVPFGSTAVLADADTIAPSFTPELEGTYRVFLTVNDGLVDSVPRLAEVVVGNMPPTAVIAGPSTAGVGAVVTLDGSASADPEGEPLSYAWSLAPPGTSAAVLSGDDTVGPTFSPDLPGVYVVTLTTSDGSLQSMPSQLQINVVNDPPVVDAGADQVADFGELVTLAGTATDPNGDVLSVSWQILSAPPGSLEMLAQATSLTPSFTPDRSGEYQLQLTASDGAALVSDVVTIAVVEDMDILDFLVRDADYSRGLDKLIFVTTAPPTLHIYDPVTTDDTSIALPLAPTTVALDRAGTRAAVGHNGWVSIIDLSGAALEKTIPVSTDVIDVALGDNGYVYCFPRIDQWEQIRSINIATGAETLGGSIRAGTLVKLHPTQDAIYGADNGLSPSDIEKYDISGGPALFAYDSPYHGDYPMCGNLWIADDGLRIFTRCGYVFRSDTVRPTDMVYNGKLGQVSVIGHLDHHAGLGRVAVLPGNGWMTPDEDTEIQFYGYDFLTYQVSVGVPQFYFGGSFHVGHGRYVFWNSDGTEYYLIAQADASAGALYDFAVVRRQAP